MCVWSQSLNHEKKVKIMQQRFYSNLHKVQVFFGPSARICCYQVSESFYKDFVIKHSDSSGAFVKKNDGWYFDNSWFLQETMKKFGIKNENIYTNNAFCTICNVEFCSFRRQKEHANRQVTLVALR